MNQYTYFRGTAQPRPRTTNVLERAVQPEMKRRTQPVRVFTDVVAVERLVGAILVGIDEKWMFEPQLYLN